MNHALLTYGRSAQRALIGLQDGRPCSQLKPGDLVQHAMWVGTFGVLVSKVSDEHMTVLWTIAPGPKRQALDRLMDQDFNDNPNYGFVTIAIDKP